MSPAAAYVNPMPLFHTGGCVLACSAPCQRRATLVQMQMFDPGLMLELIETYRGTHMLGVPTMLIAMMEHPTSRPETSRRSRRVCSGGSTVPRRLVRRIETSLGADFSIVYGQTEASPGITLIKLDDSPEDKADTLGPALPQIEIKVVDPETGETCPSANRASSAVAGICVMLELLRDAGQDGRDDRRRRLAAHRRPR